jgi:hypothetical protein
MSLTGSWVLQGIDIGIPLDMSFNVSAEVSDDRVNGSKSQGILKSIDTTEFKVKLFKEFTSFGQEKLFRQQLMQLQNGYEFMPYFLETNDATLEFHEHLVNVKNISLDKEGGKVLWTTYEMTLVDMGHRDEFIGYIQYRANVVSTPWDSIEANREVHLSFPVGAFFHSDSPTSTIPSEWGGIDTRTNPSSFTMSYQGGVGKERVGIKAMMDGVQFFSPYGKIGAGFEVSNGVIKLIWDSSGHVTYQRWDNLNQQWDIYQSSAKAPEFSFQGIDEDLNVIGNVNTRTALFTKLQLKRFTSEYIEIEQEFQWSNGMVCAIMWHMRRGEDDVQIRGRGINCGLDFWYMYHYIDYNHLFGQLCYYNGTSTVLSSSTNIQQDLTAPSFYVDLHDNYGAGYIGITNPDKYKNVQATIIANQSEGYFTFSTRHSWNLNPKVWSPPIMFWQGSSSPLNKERQSGFLIDGNGQVLHRSRVY